jgi:hypothetical protein
MAGGTVMIIKLENVTVRQLDRLFNFFESDTNHKSLPEDGGRFQRFVVIKECKLIRHDDGVDNSRLLPDFQLTLEVTEHVFRCQGAGGDYYSPLYLLTKLMQTLGLFPNVKPTLAPRS